MTGYGMYIEYATVYRVYSTAMLTPSIFMKVVLGFAYTYNDDFGLLPNMGKILVGIAIGNGYMIVREAKIRLTKVRWKME